MQILIAWFKRLFFKPQGIASKPEAPEVKKENLEPKKISDVSIETVLRESLVHFWELDLGQREDQGKNRSLMIDHINFKLGVPMGSPYCIGGLLVQGVEPLCFMYHLKNPIPMTASTQEFWRNAPARFLRPNGKPGKKGDICIMQNKAAKNYGHAYGLTEDEGRDQKTIDYNTNLGGSRDGDGVFELVRNQGGTATKTYLGAVDVVAWIMEANGLV